VPKLEYPSLSGRNARNNEKKACALEIEPKPNIVRGLALVKAYGNMGVLLGPRRNGAGL